MLMTLFVQIGPEICVFKTHVDAFETWDAAIAEQLQQLANKHSELSLHFPLRLMTIMILADAIYLLFMSEATCADTFPLLEKGKHIFIASHHMHLSNHDDMPCRLHDL